MEREMSVFGQRESVFEKAMEEMSERPWKLVSEAAPKVAVAEAGAANKLPWSDIELALAGYLMPPAGAKKTKTVMVKQEYIDWLLTRAPEEPYPFIPEDSIQQMIPKNQEKMNSGF